MKKISEYLTKKGWKQDWDQTKADARELKRALNYRFTGKVGKAYGFLQYDVDKEILKKEIEASQITTQAPSGLEIAVDAIDEFKVPIGLENIQKEQKAAGKNYVLTASYRGATNSQTKEHLDHTLYGLYTEALYEKSRLFQKGNSDDWQPSFADED